MTYRSEGLGGSWFHSHTMRMNELQIWSVLGVWNRTVNECISDELLINIKWRQIFDSLMMGKWMKFRWDTGLLPSLILEMMTDSIILLITKKCDVFEDCQHSISFASIQNNTIAVRNWENIEGNRGKENNEIFQIFQSLICQYGITFQNKLNYLIMRTVPWA